MRPAQSGHGGGFTLLEILTTIVVIGVAASALLSVFTGMVKTSADPVIQQQAISIAEAYMEEIRLKAFAIGPETTRDKFDDMKDYDGLIDVGAKDQNNVPIPALSAYTIAVTVLIDDLNSILVADAAAFRIDISVDHAAIEPIVLSGYRTNY